MKQQLLNWKTLGALACALVLGASLQAQTALPKVVLRATDPTALEGTTAGAFTLIRNGDTNGSLDVNVTISGTASNGVDYVAIASVITLPAGALAVDIPVTPLSDTVNRGNKTVVLTVETNAAYRVGNHKATVKIVDDVFDIPPPTIALTNPVDGAIFTAPATITLQAAVSDPELPVQSVSFYADDEFVGKVTNSPYSLVLHNVRAGNFTLFARAVDQFGKSSVSETVDITVSATPVVTLVPDDTNPNVGEQVTLQAQIGDPNEPISSVTFTLDGKVLGTVTSAPFNFLWTPTKVGTFTAQATATDANTGKKGSSAKVPIKVIFGGGA